MPRSSVGGYEYSIDSISTLVSQQIYDRFADLRIPAYTILASSRLVP